MINKRMPAKKPAKTVSKKKPVKKPVKKKLVAKGQPKTGTKAHANKHKLPFFKAELSFDEDRQTRVDVDFNAFFIHALDQEYVTNPSYNRSMSDNDKVAFHLFVIMEHIAGPLFDRQFAQQPDGMSEEEEALSQVPPMAFRGPTQVIDLGKPNSDETGALFDFTE